MLDRNMFENTVLAALTVCPGLGSIQVRKAICIADAVHYSLHGKGITGVRYIKEKMGPVPDRDGYICLTEMAISGKIDTHEEEAGRYTKIAYYAGSKPDYSVFTESQISIINYSARLASSHSATDLSFKTHDAVYDGIGMFEEIPLNATCSPIVTGYDTGTFTDTEIKDVEAFFASDENRLLAVG